MMAMAFARRRGIEVAVAAAAALFVFAVPRSGAQDAAALTVKAGTLATSIRLDGALDEPVWETAPAIENLTMAEPTPGASPAGVTLVRILANHTAILIGITCDDPVPDGIVSHTKVRDATLTAEDYVKVVIDTFQDGRSGYVFAVNPGGARYDAIIEPGTSNENANWDGIWEAATHRDPQGWSVEIRIPVATLGYRKDLHAWRFNVERHVQRLQETDRWAGATRDYKVTQTKLAGLLTDLPDFDLGIGLSVRPSVVTGGGKPAPDASVKGTYDASLDVTERLGPNLLGSVTVNTDFAETEVDTRQTNFTRFPLFFPEKRAFFLEGADTFAFGLNLGSTIVPYYSRRMGLVAGQEVPIDAGGKINGSIGATKVGVQLVRTGDASGVAPAATLGVVRLKQNVFAESSIGMIATVGDPRGRSGSWLAGGDFTYRTSSFHGRKNLAMSVWALAMDRAGLGPGRHAEGASFEYPNDRINTWVRVRQVGRNFDPSLGFVDRTDVRIVDSKFSYNPRPHFWGLRQMHFETHTTITTDIAGNRDTIRLFYAPLFWQFESGESIEWDIVPAWERLPRPFQVAPNVVLPAGDYQYTYQRVQFITATKRKLSASLNWHTAGFYSGTLNQYTATAAWSPNGLVTVEFSGEHDIGRLPQGNFTEDLFGTRLRLNFSPDLQLSSYVQYDSRSRLLGTNSRLRWTFRALGDLFIIYNHNVHDILDRWQLDSNQLLVKLQYAIRR